MIYDIYMGFAKISWNWNGICRIFFNMPSPRYILFVAKRNWIVSISELFHPFRVPIPVYKKYFCEQKFSKVYTNFSIVYKILIRECCDFCDKSTCMSWILQQKWAYVVSFATKVCVCCDFSEKSAHMLWFLQQKCAYVVIFTTKIVFLVFLVQTPVFRKFLVPTLAQFIGSCQQKQ